MKKFISVLLSLAMVLSFCSFAVFADGGDTADVYAVVATEPLTEYTVKTDANDIQVGDLFEVACILDNFNVAEDYFTSIELQLAFNKDVVALWDISEDTDADPEYAEYAMIINTTDFPESVGTGRNKKSYCEYMYTITRAGLPDAVISQQTANKDKRMPFTYSDYPDGVEVVRFVFKAIDNGDTGIKLNVAKAFLSSNTQVTLLNDTTKPIVVGGSAPVDDTTITAELGFDNAGKFAIDFIFNSTGTLATTANVVKQDGRTIAENVEITADNNSIGIATNDTNAIYTATAANGAECKASIYSVVIDDIMNSNYDKNITPINLKMINDVLAKGGLFTEGGALTAETAKIVTMNEDGSYSLTDKAVKAGITFAVDGVILGDTVDALEAEVYALDAIQLEFVPELIEEVVVDGSNEIESGSFEDIM